MIRILRVVLSALGFALVAASSFLTWVVVDVDLEAIGELSDGAVDAAVGTDSETRELLDDATDAIDRVRDVVPEGLIEASLNGQNAYDLLGFGFLVVGLAGAAAVCAVWWAVGGTRWLRWIGIVLALLVIALVPAVMALVVLTDSLLDTFLPESWKRFSPSFDVTLWPLGSVAGAVLIVGGMLGRSPNRPSRRASQGPQDSFRPQPPSDLPITPA